MKVYFLLVAVTCAMAAAEGGDARPGYLFIDAGSSGSKCTALNHDLTAMRGDKVKPPLAQMADDAAYRNALAAKLKEQYAMVEPGAFTPKNRLAVPIQATAGMRLISKEANDAIWGKICGKTGGTGPNQVKFATGAKCGTIPGTTEGYFEWVAGGAHSVGSICSGGASLQIATPIYSETGEQSFKALVHKAKGIIKCNELTLADGKLAPVFSTSKNCVDDYIAYHAKGSPVIAGCPPAMCGKTIKTSNGQTLSFRGLAVVSFLGLRGHGGFFYGGINEVSAVMESECADKTFNECKTQFAADLAKDHFHTAVAEWFKADNRHVIDYKFGTAAANARKTTLDTNENVKNAASGTALETAVNAYCGASAGKGKGTDAVKGPLSSRPADYQTCMKGWFTANIATGFFTPKEAAIPENEKADIDWALGASKAQKSAFLEAGEGVDAMAHLEQLTNDVQKSMAGDFTKGAMIHYANLDAMANEHKMLRTQK